MRQSSGVRVNTSKLEAVRRLSGEMAMPGNREEREQRRRSRASKAEGGLGVEVGAFGIVDAGHGDGLSSL